MKITWNIKSTDPYGYVKYIKFNSEEEFLEAVKNFKGMDGYTHTYTKITEENIGLKERED